MLLLSSLKTVLLLFNNWRSTKPPYIMRPLLRSLWGGRIVLHTQPGCGDRCSPWAEGWVGGSQSYRRGRGCYRYRVVVKSLVNLNRLFLDLWRKTCWTQFALKVRLEAFQAQDLKSQLWHRYLSGVDPALGSSDKKKISCILIGYRYFISYVLVKTLLTLISISSFLLIRRMYKMTGKSYVLPYTVVNVSLTCYYPKIISHKKKQVVGAHYLNTVFKFNL